MKVLSIEANVVTLQLTAEDVQTIEKYARREEITTTEAIQEAVDNGIEGIAFKA